jgi:hypothetical protein
LFNFSGHNDIDIEALSISDTDLGHNDISTNYVLTSDSNFEKSGISIEIKDYVEFNKVDNCNVFEDVDYFKSYFKDYLYNGLVTDICELNSSGLLEANSFILEGLKPCPNSSDMPDVDVCVNSNDHGICSDMFCMHPLCFNSQGFSELDFNVDDIIKFIKF